jgi:hypothetical protein
MHQKHSYDLFDSMKLLIAANFNFDYMKKRETQRENVGQQRKYKEIERERRWRKISLLNFFCGSDEYSFQLIKQFSLRQMSMVSHTCVHTFTSSVQLTFPHIHMTFNSMSFINYPCVIFLGCLTRA